ncbi:MAG: hypothetical protein WCT51_02740 [Candidatus Shapirobacteria bacterium]|jgi:hypothetical protein
MNTLDLIIQAIETQKPIVFEYNKEGKIQGERKGNPHAIFIFTKKSGEQSTKIHIVQTDGVSDTTPPNFPDFRTFDIEDLSLIKILEDEESFVPFYEKYNPESEMYKDVIAKI